MGGEPVRPAPGRVLVLRLPLPLDAASLGRVRATLADDERERAERLRVAPVRAEYEATRGWLRWVLGGCVGADPASLRFSYGEHGKPRLEGHPGAPHFNVAHAAGLAVCALTEVGPVGVDVERLDRDVEVATIAARFFTPGECRAIEALPAERRRHAFLRCWTRKEAYLKALGSGITAGLARPEVSVDDAPALLGDRDDATAPTRFRLFEVDAGPAHLVATAVEVAGPSDGEAGVPASIDGRVMVESRVWSPV